MTWLQLAAAESPSIHAAGDLVASQGPGRRTLILGYAAQILGSVFNLAGVPLLASMIVQARERSARRRVTRALVTGFAAGSCWSPFFVGTAMILAFTGVRIGLAAIFGTAVLVILMRHMGAYG